MKYIDAYCQRKDFCWHQLTHTSGPPDEMKTCVDDVKLYLDCSMDAPINEAAYDDCMEQLKDITCSVLVTVTTTNGTRNTTYHQPLACTNAWQ